MRISAFLFSLLLAMSSVRANVYEVHAFESYSSPKMVKMKIVGKIIAKTKSLSSDRKNVLDYDAREMILSARLFSTDDLRLGDKVYIIEKDPDHEKFKNGYIIGEAVLYSMFKTEFQGWMGKASGNISMVSAGQFLAVEDRKNQRKNAALLTKRAEKYEYIEDDPKAIFYYNKSLEEDPDRPETYMKMAMLYNRKGSYTMAISYLNKAWDRLNRFESPNRAFSLPGYYIEWNLKVADAESKNEIDALKRYIKIKGEIDSMQKKISYFKDQLPPGIYKMMKDLGIPDVRFQYNYAMLMERIYHIMKKIPLTRVIRMLSEEERNWLYQPMEMMVNNRKVFLKPKAEWEKAYFEASLFHYRMAVELDDQHENALFQIVYLASLGASSAQGEIKKRYVDFIEFYGEKFLTVSDKSIQLNFVRNRMNTLDQL